ncbi:unnamed protein product, partial [Rhizoctonia solani]
AGITSSPAVGRKWELLATMTPTGLVESNLVHINRTQPNPRDEEPRV